MSVSTAAVERLSSPPRPPDGARLGDWLRIEPNGGVTAFTGKVEVGQGSRTSLAQIVAAELRVPFACVRLVMGDTACTPFDAGTFGSRTTATMGPQLRVAAAVARERLRALAADRWGVPLGEVAADGGSVCHSPSGRLLPYETLAGAALDDTPLAGSVEWSAEPLPLEAVVPRVNGRDVVTGRHQYTPDIRLPGMLFGKVLRPPQQSATLQRLDVSEAQALPDVTVIHDGDFVGVAAPDARRAAQALALLRAEWTAPQLPARRDLEAYLRAHPDEPSPQGRPGAQEQEIGDVAAAWRKADILHEETYSTAYIAHAPLEPRAAVAAWREDTLIVWTGTQRPFGVRGQLVEAFGLPESAVRVIVPDTGSGYGGKHTGEPALEAARLARAAQRPVQVVWTREEEFTHAYFRPAAVIDIRSGLTSDGRLLAWEHHNYNAGPGALQSRYDIPNQRVAYHPSRSPLRQGSYRALAATANIFARETHMDELAYRTGSDPLDFRLRHLTDFRLRAVLEAAAERFGWQERRLAPNHGFGLACGTEKGGYIACCAEVVVDSISRSVAVRRLVAAYECGAIVNPGNLRNQIEGAVVQGLGGALYEMIDFAGGRIRNPRFSRYRVPRFSDAPAIETVLLDRPDLPPAGAGETPITGVAPAVGNAIFAATGVRLRALPLLPNGVLPEP